MSSWWDERAHSEHFKTEGVKSLAKHAAQRAKPVGKAASWGTALAPDAANCSPEKKKEYYARRIVKFEEFFAREEKKKAEAVAKAEKIEVVMPDGAVREGVKYVTTPLDIAAGISKKLGKEALIAKVNGEMWDVFRPLEQDRCDIQLFTFAQDEGKNAYWHSSAHLLGQALELEFGADLTIGPPIEEGFYYDCFMGDRTLVEEDRAKIEKRIEAIIKEKQVFQRAQVTRQEALDVFQENAFKIEIINGLPEGAPITLYRNGPFCDLCRGGHVPTSGSIKCLSLGQMSRAFWRADVNNAPLMRVYGVSFPDKKLLKQYHTRIAEAKKRDHRVIGLSRDLFFFHNVSPGSCFFQPYGNRVYNALIQYCKEKYWEYGYEEVTTPNIFHVDLWNTSGHAAHYKQNMFCFHVEKEEWGLKPMNCPGHCVLFSHRKHSFRELPIRYAEFGVLHRNEFSGALHGLTRVRRFAQDDAHIFCRRDQIGQEVGAYLKMFSEVYGTFGLEYDLALSTRPEGFLGAVEDWDQAEAALQSVLDAWEKDTGKGWALNPADGAFYGPKIDITVYDALGRKFQCATVQLDFQLPVRFGLSYVNKENKEERPVIVHRAIMGSFERMIAILTEHFAGKWPLWLSPKQVMVVPISNAVADYAEQVKRQFRAAHFFCECDQRDMTMQKKVRDAQLEQFNYILVVGAKEAEQGTVNVRTRDNKVHGERKVQDLIEVLEGERKAKALQCGL